MGTFLSLAQTEDKVLALFSGTGLFVLLEQFFQAQADPRLQAVGGLLVAVGVLLKSVIASTPSAPAPVLYVKNADGTYSPKP